MLRSLVGSEMCIRDSIYSVAGIFLSLLSVSTNINIADVFTEALCGKQMQPAAAAAATAAPSASAATAQDDDMAPVRAGHDEEQGAVGGEVGGEPSDPHAIRDNSIAASFEVLL